jgi:Na+:H+ antiporter, NhaA family
VRVLLLALAIIDDVAAVIVIAVFYSQELNAWGGLVAVCGIGWVLIMQRLGIRPAVAYVVPGVILWFGLWLLGVHPTLAGVILGLLTPVSALEGAGQAELTRARLHGVAERVQPGRIDSHVLNDSLNEVRTVQLALVPPVVSVETALHPWVAYCIMPLFALANAGVSLDAAGQALLSNRVAHGIILGLLLGKPLGILFASWLAIRLGLSALPVDAGPKGLLLVALLGGIGFTMSIFIATLAFQSGAMLEAAKLSVLAASGLAALMALVFGRFAYR